MFIVIVAIFDSTCIHLATIISLFLLLWLVKVQASFILFLFISILDLISFRIAKQT